LRKMVLMPKRYPPEVREKAVRLALDRLDEYGSAYAAAHAIGPRVDVHPETLRVWIVAALKAAAEKPAAAGLMRPSGASWSGCAGRTGS